MLKHVVRIELDGLRIPLLCAVWPFEFVAYLMTCLLPAAWGGHPDKLRLLQLDFYARNLAIFWAAWDGHFVPDRSCS